MIQYSGVFEIYGEAAAYWIARSSRVTTVGIVAVAPGNGRHCEERSGRSNPAFCVAAPWIASLRFPRN